MRTCLITGGAGYIGSNLSRALLERGYQVVAVDDFSSGSHTNIEDLTSRENFTVIEADFADLDAYREPLGSADCLFHLAGPVGVKNIVEASPSSAALIEKHTAAVRQMLEATGSGLRSAFLASSSEIYGQAEDGKPANEVWKAIDEATQPDVGAADHPRWWYAHLKMNAEKVFHEFSYSTGRQICIGRLFNITGRDHAAASGMVVPAFVAQALAGEPLTIYGDGSQVRSFCSIHDAVEAMIHLVCEMDHVETPEQIFNIGRRQPTTISGLAELVNRKTGNGSGVTYRDYEEALGTGDAGDIHYRVPDIKRLVKYGYHPRRTLEEIVDEMIAYRTGVKAVNGVSG